MYLYTSEPLLLLSHGALTAERAGHVLNLVCSVNVAYCNVRLYMQYKLADNLMQGNVL